MMTSISSSRILLLFNATTAYRQSSSSRRPALLQAKKISSHASNAKLSASSSTSSKLSKAAATSVVCSLIILSDPISSRILFGNKQEDEVNNSYWAQELQQATAHQQEQCSTDGRLRNAHKFCLDNKSSRQNAEVADNNIQLPSHSRIVIVGGGFAGLHTALALAEKMSLLKKGIGNLDDGSVVPPPAQYQQTENEGMQMQSRRSTNSWYQWVTWPFIAKSNDSNNHNLHSNVNGEIIILEANQIGAGSSGRAKGLVVPGYQVPLEDLEEGAVDNGGNNWTVPLLLHKLHSFLSTQPESPRYTKGVVQELYKLSYIALDRLRSIVDLYEIDCDWVECGAVEGSIHAMEGEEEDEEESDGCRILTREQVNELMGRSSCRDDSNSESDGDNLYQWGEYDPGCAGVNPLKLTLGLADAAERWGVRIYEQTKLIRLEKTKSVNDESTKDNSGKYTLTTNYGDTIQCDHVVLCTGADALSTDVSRRLEQSFVPIYTWMAATEPLYDLCPLKDSVDSNIYKEQGHQKKRPAPMCGDDHISLNYWRNNNKDEGRLLFGSLADTFVLPNWLISWRLRNAMKEVYPQLAHVHFDHIWGGKLAFALNSMPLIGRDTDFDDIVSDTNEETKSSKNGSSGVWYATGFAGHGIVPTAMAGSVLANAILETPDQQQWKLFQTYFPPSSFNGYPYSQLGAGIILSLYNVWDWAGKKGMPLPALPKLW